MAARKKTSERSPKPADSPEATDHAAGHLPRDSSREGGTHPQSEPPLIEHPPNEHPPYETSPSDGSHASVIESAKLSGAAADVQPRKRGRPPKKKLARSGPAESETVLVEADLGLGAAGGGAPETETPQGGPPEALTGGQEGGQSWVRMMEQSSHNEDLEIHETAVLSGLPEGAGLR